MARAVALGGGGSVRAASDRVSKRRGAPVVRQRCAERTSNGQRQGVHAEVVAGVTVRPGPGARSKTHSAQVKPAVRRALVQARRRGSSGRAAKGRAPRLARTVRTAGPCAAGGGVWCACAWVLRLPPTYAKARRLSRAGKVAAGAVHGAVLERCVPRYQSARNEPQTTPHPRSRRSRARACFGPEVNASQGGMAETMEAPRTPVPKHTFVSTLHRARGLSGCSPRGSAVHSERSLGTSMFRRGWQREGGGPSSFAEAKALADPPSWPAKYCGRGQLFEFL